MEILSERETESRSTLLTVESGKRGFEAMDIQLYKAIASGDEAFILKEEDLGKRTVGDYNILHVAALNKKENIAKKIIDKVIHTLPEILFHQNSDGDTPLHVAAKVGCLEIVRLILNTTYKDIEKGKRLTEFVNNKEDTTLHMAVKMGHFLIVKQLLGKEPEFVSFVNKAKESPLFLAIEKNFFDAAELFLNIEVNKGCAYSGREGMNALHASVIRWANIDKGECNFGDSRLSQVLKLTRLRGIMKEVMIKCPSAAVEQDEDLKWTPLHFASYYGCCEVVELILQTHNDIHELVSVKDKEGMSALHIAASNGSVEEMKMLIEHCPILCELLNNKEQTALHSAAENGQEKSVRYLLKTSEMGSDLYINKQDKDGNTPAHLAAYKGIEKGLYGTLQTLIQVENKKMDGTLVNNKGLTVFDVILSSENPPIILKLLFFYMLRVRSHGVTSLKGQVEEKKMEHLKIIQVKQH